MSAYYNEFEPYAAAWLRNLISAGHIAAGEVDTRSIREVQADDVRGFTQAHFFAGIGVWSHALRLAGWDDDRPVWTGSCPCQPFSAAGQQRGTDDDRHLWPEFHRLIAECRPPVVLGEQVAAKAADAWIDLVQHDLEGLGYAVGAVPIPAAGVGAPHIRDRLWWVADAAPGGRREQRHAVGAWQGRHADGSGDASGVMADAAEQRSPAGAREPGRGHGAGQPERPGVLGRLAHPGGAGLEGRERPGERVDAQRPAAERDGAAGGVADADGGDAGAEGLQRGGEYGQQQGDGGAGDGRGAGPLHGFWRDADWLLCRDGKWRPVEPGTFPLAHGAPARVGRLRAYGNAIVAPLAAEFIAAVMECRP